MGFLSGLFGGKAAGGGKTNVNVAKRFELRGRTGQGSMSKVYQAYDRELGRSVCLKVLDKEKTQKFEDRFKGLKHKKPGEGELCLGLKHRNIVTTYEYGTTNVGEPYLVMEWVEGSGLNFLIETRNAQLDGRRVDTLCQICDALDYLHAQRFIHRDLCPRNIMVTTEGVVQLIDFGLTVPYTPEYTQPGNRTGSADYLAPEIIKRTTTDHRVDVFALGVTAFEVFTGEVPWERATSSEETLRRRLNTPPRNAKDLNPKLDEELVAVLMRSVERDKNARFPTVEAMKKALYSLENQEY